MTARELAASARNALLVVTLADGATPDEARELHAAVKRVEAVLSELALRSEERDAADARAPHEPADDSPPASLLGVERREAMRAGWRKLEPPTPGHCTRCGERFKTKTSRTMCFACAFKTSRGALP